MPQNMNENLSVFCPAPLRAPGGRFGRFSELLPERSIHTVSRTDKGKLILIHVHGIFTHSKSGRWRHFFC